MNYAIFKNNSVGKYLNYKNVDMLTEKEKLDLINEGWKEVEDVNFIDEIPEYHEINYIISVKDDNFYGIYSLNKKTIEINNKIKELKEELSSSDYKINKNLEAQMAGVEYPYDPKKLHEERQALRDKINELEELLKQ